MKKYISKVRHQESMVIENKAVVVLWKRGKRKAVVLTPQLTRVWENFKGEMTVESLVKRFAKVLHVDYKESHKKIEACISELVQARLVTVSAVSKYSKKSTCKEINKIEKIYVISLESKPDRKRAMEQRLSTLLSMLDKKIDICFFKALDWRHVTNEYFKSQRFSILKDWKMPGSKNEFYAREMLKGEIATSLSHFFVWKLMKKEKIRKALILEDDAAFADDPGVILFELEAALRVLQKKAPDWEFVYLERSPVMADRGFLAKNVVIPGYSYCTTGYIVTEKGIDKLLRANLQKNIIHIDEFIPALYCKHPRKDVDKVFGKFKKLRAFSIEPPLLEQCGTSAALNSDTYQA